METNVVQKTIHQALVSAQSKIRAACKSGENTYDKYRYAMLQDYCNAIHDPMTENGLALSVSIDEITELPDRITSQGKIEHVVRVGMRGILIHESGSIIEFLGHGEGQDRADKALYKAITGGKKYLIANIFNVPTTDDPETDSHEDFDQRTTRQNLPTNQSDSKAPTSPKNSKAPTPPPKPKAPTGEAGRQKTNAPYEINEKEQQDRGCINTVLVAELRSAVLKQDKANKLDPTSQFLPWLDSYLDALYAASGMENYTRKHKGTARVLLDVPSTAYTEILERVQKEPETCRLAGQSDDGVA